MFPVRFMIVMLLLLLIAPISAQAQAGRGCSAFSPCPDNYSCMPFRQVCHRDSGAREGEACQAGYGCARGFKCEAGSQVCRGPGKEGDACHATRPCGSGLTCEAGSQRCRAPGREGDSCHATRPCGGGLTCEAGSQTCRGPGGVGDACHVTRPCGGGLTCQPGVHKCYHSPRKAGEPCVVGFGCGPGLYCQSFLQKCVPQTVNYQGNSPCAALRVQATAEDARRANLTMSFSAGSAGGAGAYISYETGVVYGNNGQFGCFATACAGNQSDVSFGNFANFGLTNRYEDFTGFSVVTNQGVDTPFVNLGFQTSQVFSAQAPQRPGQILQNRLVGTTSGLTYGVGLSPINVGSAICYTARLDEGDPLGEFANIKSLLSSWGKLGFAPEARPQRLGGAPPAASPPPYTPPPRSAPPPAAPSNQSLEQTCYGMVQGRIPWARGGSTQWVDGNVRRLCAGTTNPQGTVDCFNRAIASHNSWQRGLDECGGGQAVSNSAPPPRPAAPPPPPPRPAVRIRTPRD